MTIIIDDTTQTITSTLNPSIINNQSQYSTYVSSNTFYSSNSNALYQLGLRYTKTEVDTNFYSKTATDTLLNAKQDTLTASTTLLGNGGSITDINWNNITTNKPTTFASDWSIVANKPTTFPPITTNLITTTGGQTINGNLTTTGYLYIQSSIYTQNILPFSTGTAQAITIRSRLAGNTNIHSETGFINLYTNNILRLQITDTGNTVISGTISEGGTLLSTKYQATLTATTNLLGNGGSITDINWNNINTNKPTTFASDWSIVANKPTTFPADMTTIYSKTETDTLLNGKENSLIFNTPLIRTTNTISIDTTNFFLKTGGHISSYVGIGTAITTNAMLIIEKPTGFPIGGWNVLLTSLDTTSTIDMNFLTDDGKLATVGIGNTGNTYSNSLFLNSPKDLYFITNNFTNSATILANGNFGIGTTSPTQLLDVYTDGLTTNNYLRIRANTLKEAGIKLERSGIVWNIFNKGSSYTGQVNNFAIYNNAGSSTLEITQSGNVGIGTTNPMQIFQIGSGGRLRISNNTADYTLLGTNEIDGITNTRIVLSGNTRASPYAGNIEYLSTAGSHIFYTSASNERMRILNNGNVGIGTPAPRVALDVQTKIYVGGSLNAVAPQVGIYGGTSDRLILWAASSVSTYPFSLGIAPSTLWYSVPNNSLHSFFINGSEYFRISNGGIYATGSTYFGALDTSGLRLAKNDIFTNTANAGGITIWTQNTTQPISLGYLGGNGIILTVNNTSVNISQPLVLGTGMWHNSADGVNRVYYAADGTSYFHSGNGNYIFRNTANSINTLTLDNNGALTTTGNISTSSSISSSFNINAKRYICNATTISYTTNWNGTSYSGWFISFNDFLYAGTTSYITLCFNHATTIDQHWFGRLLFSWNGTYAGTAYLVQFFTDNKYPASGNAAFNIQAVFDGSGNGAIWISQAIANVGNLSYKIYG